MDIEFIKRNDGLVNWLDENHKGKWSSCKSTFDTIVWKDDATDIPTQADYDAVKETFETAVENKINQQATDKANGNQKLLDLGLTQAEATALTGYTPPASEE